MEEIQNFSFRCQNADPEEVSDFYRGNLSPILFRPLSPGALISNEHTQYHTREWKLWNCNCTSGMHLSYKAVPDIDSHVIYLPEGGTMQLKTGTRVQEASWSELLLSNMARFDEITVFPERAHLALSMTNDMLSARLSDMLDEAVTKDLVFLEVFPLQTPAGQQIASLVRFLWQYLQNEGGSRSQRGHRHLLEAAIIAILEKVPHNFSERLLKAAPEPMPLRLRRAVEFMHAHAGEALTIVDVAKAAGTSVRALQLSFQKHKGTTPLAYLRAIRVRGAHEELRRADTSQTVSQIAARWGFTHVGRFAQHYFDVYGEMPSTTLRRR
jgi:AraC-like DNA-binding protein